MSFQSGSGCLHTVVIHTQRFPYFCQLSLTVDLLACSPFHSSYRQTGDFTVLARSSDCLHSSARFVVSMLVNMTHTIVTWKFRIFPLTLKFDLYKLRAFISSFSYCKLCVLVSSHRLYGCEIVDDVHKKSLEYGKSPGISVDGWRLAIFHNFHFTLFSSSSLTRVGKFYFNICANGWIEFEYFRRVGTLNLKRRRL